MGGVLDFLAGLAQGGQNPYNGDQQNTIGDRFQNGLRAMSEGYGNFQADAAKAKALRQVVAAYAQDEPDPDKQANIIAQSHTMGLGDLEGFVQSHAIQQAQRMQQADVNEKTARANYYQQFAAMRRQQADSDQGFAKMMQTLDGYVNPQQDPLTGEPMTDNPAAAQAAANMPAWKKLMIHAAASAGATNPSFAGKVASQLMQGGEEDGGVKPLEMTTKSGTELVYNPKSGAFMAPNKGADELMATKPDPEDVPDGYMPMQVGKGWQIKPDPSRWATRIEPDPENPLAQIHRQILLPKPGAAKPATMPGAKGMPMPTATATNPKTGERMMWKDGQWMPLR